MTHLLIVKIIIMWGYENNSYHPSVILIKHSIKTVRLGMRDSVVIS